jgi:hypothetical protein
MGEMCQEGLIETDRRYIKILDKGKMNQLLMG